MSQMARKLVEALPLPQTKQIRIGEFHAWACEAAASISARTSSKGCCLAKSACRLRFRTSRPACLVGGLPCAWKNLVLAWLELVWLDLPLRGGGLVVLPFLPIRLPVAGTCVAGPPRPCVGTAPPTNCEAASILAWTSLHFLKFLPFYLPAGTCVAGLPSCWGLVEALPLPQTKNKLGRYPQQRHTLPESLRNAPGPSLPPALLRMPP